MSSVWRHTHRTIRRKSPRRVCFRVTRRGPIGLSDTRERSSSQSSPGENDVRHCRVVMATSFTEGAHILDSIHDVQPWAPIWYDERVDVRVATSRSTFILNAPPLHRASSQSPACFHPVLPIPRHGDGGVQLSPFPSLGAASAFTPQDGHRRGFM